MPEHRCCLLVGLSYDVCAEACQFLDTQVQAAELRVPVRRLEGLQLRAHPAIDRLEEARWLEGPRKLRLGLHHLLVVGFALDLRVRAALLLLLLDPFRTGGILLGLGRRALHLLLDTVRSAGILLGLPPRLVHVVFHGHQQLAVKLQGLALRLDLRAKFPHELAHVLLELTEGALLHRHHHSHIAGGQRIQHLAEFFVLDGTALVLVHQKKHRIQALWGHLEESHDLSELSVRLESESHLFDGDGPREVRVNLRADLEQLRLGVPLLNLFRLRQLVPILRSRLRGTLHDDRKDQVHDAQRHREHDGDRDDGQERLRLNNWDIDRAPAVAGDDGLEQRERRIDHRPEASGAALAVAVVDEGVHRVHKLDEHDTPANEHEPEQQSAKEDGFKGAHQSCQQHVEFTDGQNDTEGSPEARDAENTQVAHVDRTFEAKREPTCGNDEEIKKIPAVLDIRPAKDVDVQGRLERIHRQQDHVGHINPSNVVRIVRAQRYPISVFRVALRAIVRLVDDQDHVEYDNGSHASVELLRRGDLIQPNSEGWPSSFASFVKPRAMTDVQRNSGRFLDECRCLLRHMLRHLRRHLLQKRGSSVPLPLLRDVALLLIHFRGRGLPFRGKLLQGRGRRSFLRLFVCNICHVRRRRHDEKSAGLRSLSLSLSLPLCCEVS
mmetsp:Transcript_40119/g.128768  ORF Transcript_40119/g.128768 Transcript_40119/m.128768 type:complete len:664 (+) Transcript_40119:478-2469(+)